MARFSVQKGKSLKNISCLFIFFVSLFWVTGLCQASTTVLTSASPDHTVTTGTEETIFGTSTSNRITIESGAKAELINFPGQNVIEIEADSSGFTVSRSGTVVTLEGSDGTLLKIPATTSVQTVSFSDRAPLTLSIHDNQIMLDDQEIVLTLSLIAENAPGFLTTTQVSELYVTIFHLASEAERHSHWQSVPDSTMVSIANAMFATGFFKEWVGLSVDSNQAFIEYIYLNAFDISISDDPEGIAYWVGLLDSGMSRADVTVLIIRFVKSHSPTGSNYDPYYTKLIAAYNQFANRVEVSNYVAENLSDLPEDWFVSMRFDSHGLNVTDDPVTVTQAKRLIDIMSGALDICGAYVAPGVWKEFDCYNLAAIGKTTSDDPFIPSWRLTGGYWQWGRKGPDSTRWYNTTNFAHGPTGPNSWDTNSGDISEWSQLGASDYAWLNAYKTFNDPCPDGYRIPTQNQWNGVIGNNIQGTMGTWSDNTINYGSALFFGDNLMLPASGYRSSVNGSLGHRGYYGYYWSSTGIDDTNAWFLGFNIDYAFTSHDSRTFGFSIRCVSEK